MNKDGGLTRNKIQCIKTSIFFIAPCFSIIIFATAPPQPFRPQLIIMSISLNYKTSDGSKLIVLTFFSQLQLKSMFNGFFKYISALKSFSMYFNP